MIGTAFNEQAELKRLAEARKKVTAEISNLSQQLLEAEQEIDQLKAELGSNMIV
jgi:phage shock protein A